MFEAGAGGGSWESTIAEIWPREEAARLKSHNLGVEREATEV